MANELKRSDRINIGEEHTAEINPETLKFLEKYEMDMEIRELAPTTIYNYKKDLIQWFSYMVREQFNLGLKEVQEDDIEEFIYFCKKAGNNTERIKRRMSSISAFYKFLRKKKIVKENPMEFVSRPKRGLPVVVQTYLTVEQIGKIREFLEKSNDLMLSAYVEVSLSTMARVNAISNITWEQIDYELMTINDVLEKEGKIVDLYIDERTRDLLKELKAKRDALGIDCSHVFISKNIENYDKVVVTTLSKWCKKVGESIGVPSLHPHDFRHSSSNLRRHAGMDLETVSSLLGHESTETTRKFYLKEDKSKMGAEARRFSV